MLENQPLMFEVDWVVVALISLNYFSLVLSSYQHTFRILWFLFNDDCMINLRGWLKLMFLETCWQVDLKLYDGFLFILNFDCYSFHKILDFAFIKLAMWAIPQPISIFIWAFTVLSSSITLTSSSTYLYNQY